MARVRASERDSLPQCYLELLRRQPAELRVHRGDDGRCRGLDAGARHGRQRGHREEAEEEEGETPASSVAWKKPEATAAATRHMRPPRDVSETGGGGVALAAGATGGVIWSSGSRLNGRRRREKGKKETERKTK